MATTQIPVGINILAKEEVTRPFARITAAMERFKSSLGKTQDKAKEGLAQSAHSVHAAQKSFPPLKPPKTPQSDIILNGGGFGALRRPAELFTGGIENLTSTLKTFLLVLVGGAGVTYGLKRFSEGLSSSTLDLERLSQRVGLPVEEVRKLGYVAKASGIETSQLNQALTRLSDIRYEKKFGIPSEGVKALEALNQVADHPIQLLNQKGKRAHLENSFFDILKALKKVHDPSLKAKISTTLLGSEELLKLSALSEKEISGLTTHFKVSPFSKELIDQARGYQVAVTDLSSSLDQLKFTAGSDILKGFSQGIAESSRLIRGNQTQVTKLASDFGMKLPTAMTTAFQALNTVADCLAALDKRVGLVNISLGVLSLYTISKTVIGINQLITAMTALKAAALFANPITGIVAGTAIAAGAVYMAGSLQKDEPMISASAWKTGMLPERNAKPKAMDIPEKEDQSSLKKI